MSQPFTAGPDDGHVQRPVTFRITHGQGDGLTQGLGDRPTAVRSWRPAARRSTLAAGMQHVRAIVILLGALLWARPAAAQLDYRGIAVGLWRTDAGYSYLPQLREVRAMGANTVLFPVLTYVETVRGTEVYALDGRTAPEPVIRRAIRDAKSLGLQVAFMPVVRIERQEGAEWRGVLDPADRDTFFSSYHDMVVFYGKLAEAEGVDLFLMGSELASLEDAPHWLPIIDRLRVVYSGTLSYSANWDHYEHVPFWDRLDALALTGYYELARTNEPTQVELTGSWQWVRARLLGWQIRHLGKRIIFTEVGYHSQDGTAQTPWDYTLQHPIDLEEQRMCYEAFITAWRGQPALGGVFFWEWSGTGGSADGHYTPRHKPAADLLRDYFAADAADAAE